MEIQTFTTYLLVLFKAFTATKRKQVVDFGGGLFVCWCFGFLCVWLVGCFVCFLSVKSSLEFSQELQK